MGESLLKKNERNFINVVWLHVTWSWSNSNQNLGVNTASWSLTMDLGIPWILKPMFINACAHDKAVYGWLSGTKCAPLDGRSTTAIMTVLPCEGGITSTKSIDRSVQMQSGVDKGFSTPGVATVSPICCWHAPYFATNCSIPALIPRQWKKWDALLYVFNVREWPFAGEEWNSTIMLTFNGEVCGTTNLP